MRAVGEQATGSLRGDDPRKARLLVFAGRVARGEALLSLLERWQGTGRLAIEFAASAGELRRRLAADRWDAVIAGLCSSDDPVLDAVRELRASGSRTPFLMLSRRAGEAAAYRARTLGHCEVLELAGASEPALRDALADLLGPLDTVQPPRSSDFAPAMLWKTDTAGEFTHFTRRWSIFTGRSEEKELGRGWFDGIHPADLADWKEAYEAHVDNRREFSLDLRLRTATGAYRWVRQHGIPCFDGGRFTGYIGSAFDITDLKHANDQLVREAKRLRESKRSLEELTLNAAHDLQEPLRNLEALLRRLEGASRAGAEGLRRASLAQVGRVRALVRDIAAYTRDGTGELEIGPCAPSDSLEWALSNLRERIEEKGAVVEPEPLPRVMADPILLGRLFQNLISNALKFSGAEAPVVVVSGVRSGDEVQLWVRDEGIGIDPDHHRKIFGAFQRVHGEANEGTGMGLASCRQIVSRHGGRIWVESEPGRGSTFFFTLPAA